MGNIWIPPGRKLTAIEQEQVIDRMSDIVLKTFELRPMPSGKITEKELEDRKDLAVEMWNDLYGKQGFSKERTLDVMLRAMIVVMDGAKKHEAINEHMEEQSDCVMWSPEKENEIEAERRLSALASHKGNVIETETKEKSDESNN